MTDFVTATQPIDRDRYGRPLVAPLDGGKPIAYQRTTTFVDSLDDKFGIEKWKRRMVILGLIERPDLALSAHAHKDDKKQLDRIAEESMEAAKAHGAATIGTAIHSITEQVDRGQDVGAVPADYASDIAAYKQATAVLKMLHIETFVVLDDLKVAGTFDRVVEYDGKRYVADLKTGQIDLGAGKIAMQLAVYSRGLLYDPGTKTRTPLDVDQDRAIVIHLPAGTGTCSLHWADINQGWADVAIAQQVKEHRARKGWLAPFEPDPIAQAQAALEEAGMVAADPIIDAIDRARTTEELTGVWAANINTWQPQHTERAAAKKSLLAAA